jgi:RNA polymerase sigma-70 factor (ECF subfamily)
MPAGRRRDPERGQRFEALYVEHYSTIYAYVYRRLSDSPSDVPDAVAEVFSIAWRRLDSVPAGVDGRLWLYGTARHVVLNDWRRRRRRLRLFDRLKGVVQGRPIVDDTADSDEFWLVQAIARLPAADQEVLRLVRWEGNSHAEAAQILGCSVNAVALRLRKATARLSQDPVVEAHLERSQPESDRALSVRRK